MKRVRISKCTGQLLSAQARATASCTNAPLSTCFRAPSAALPSRLAQPTRSQSTLSASLDDGGLNNLAGTNSSLTATTEEHNSTTPSYPSPLPERALSSAKLAALHARLGLSEKIPLQTLARCLVDASADPNPHFNNANLAVIGSSFLSYYTSERLVVSYPRLPMAILFEAMRAYSGPGTLRQIAKSWGVDQAAAPGDEVDPGLLQYSLDPKAGVLHTRWGYVRKESNHIDKYKWRRGLSSRTVLDDEFGDMIHKQTHNSKDPIEEEDLAAAEREELRNNAYASFVRALIGAIYVHAGRESVHSFVNAHILSRSVNLEKLFKFKLPTRELAMLCAREGFEPPVARLLSETGRQSRTPVYVVGIYSGEDKLGEGTGASLDFARLKASMNTLKSWYLYSPGRQARVPSDMLRDDAKPWVPVYIDMGEII